MRRPVNAVMIHQVDFSGYAHQKLARSQGRLIVVRGFLESYP